MRIYGPSRMKGGGGVLLVWRGKFEGRVGEGGGGGKGWGWGLCKCCQCVCLYDLGER